MWTKGGKTLLDKASQKLFDKHGMLIIRATGSQEEPGTIKGQSTIWHSPRTKKWENDPYVKLEEDILNRVILDSHKKKASYKELRDQFMSNGVGKMTFAFICTRLEKKGKIRLCRTNGRMTEIEVLA